MNEQGLRDVERWKDKIEVRLDNRQVFVLFFGSALVACLLFVLGVIVGKRLESRGRAAAPEIDDPLALLDRIAATSHPTAEIVPPIKAAAARGPAVGGKGAKGAAKGESAQARNEPNAPATPAKSGEKAATKGESKPDERLPAERPAAAAKAAEKAPLVAPKLAEKPPAAAPKPAEKSPAVAPKAVEKPFAKAPADGAKAGDSATEKASRDLAPASGSATVKEGAAPLAKGVKDPMKEAAAAVPPGVDPKNKPHFTLQIGAFPERAEAESFAKRFTGSGKAYIVVTDIPDKGTWYRVRIGDFATFKEAQAAKGQFERQHNVIALVAPK